MNRQGNMTAGRQAVLGLGLVLSLLTPPGLAALDIFGADGSDDDFVPTENIEVDLSLAPTAAWDSLGNGDGVYDPDKWAVVFKYSEVNIPAGVTVTFKNHPSRAPVVWLVSGNATIDGVIDLKGQDWVYAPDLAEPGPGGFRGGIGQVNNVNYASGGFGIGGGGCDAQCAGNHATVGVYNDTWPTYGTDRILPLIGGSGGGGDRDTHFGGAAGGGALLLAVGGTLTIDGQIDASGGFGQNNNANSRAWFSGSGAGGAVRLIAETITGTGSVKATGKPQQGGSSGWGRIRIEALNSSANWQLSPLTSIVMPDNPVLLWPPVGAPSVRLVSIGEAAVPSDSRASFSIDQEDVRIELDALQQIVVETTNVEPTATVQVRITPQVVSLFPQQNEPQLLTAVFQSGNRDQATWMATGDFPEGYFTVQAHAVNPTP